MSQQPKPEAMPLCERICGEITGSFIHDSQSAINSGRNEGMLLCRSIIRKHFAALSVEEVARAIHGENPAFWDDCKIQREKQAQAVMQLLRKE